MQLIFQSSEYQQALQLPAGLASWSEEEFFEFCQVNRDLRIERTAKGEILIMPPAGGYSGYQSGEVFSQLRDWAKQDESGVAFDSSTGFRLPSGGMRSPDAAWVQFSRLRGLSRREKEQFIPLCPDFLIEVASPSDTVSGLHEKMEEYRQAGLPLGWLILPDLRQAEIYTPSDVKALISPDSMSGAPLLPGFKLDLAAIWNPPF